MEEREGREGQGEEKPACCHHGVQVLGGGKVFLIGLCLHSVEKVLGTFSGGDRKVVAPLG